MEIKKITRPYSLSKLQEKILQLICTTNIATYETLIKETNRDRITVLKSIQSLITYGYVKKEKINPDYEKSKLIFKTTQWGRNYALSKLGVDIKYVLSDEGDRNLTNYLRFINAIPDRSQQSKFLSSLSKFIIDLITLRHDGISLLESDFWIPKFEITQDFKDGLLKLMQSKDYNVENILNAETTNQLEKLFTPQELKEIKEYFAHIRDNLTITIEKF